MAIRLCLWALALAASKSEASFVVTTLVINCTQTNPIQPFAADFDLQGQVQKRFQLNATKNAVDYIYGNVAGEGDYIFLQGQEEQNDEKLTVLVSLDARSALIAERDTIKIGLGEDATPEQKLWAKYHSGGHALPAVWLERIGHNQLMLNHRVLVSWIGEPQVRFDEWALIVDPTTRPYVAKLVFNRSTMVASSQPFPEANFGDERALDAARGILYVQSRSKGSVADFANILGASSKGDATTQPWQVDAASGGTDILVWSTSSHAALRRIPMNGIALTALHFDPVMDRLRGVMTKSTLSNGSAEFTLVEVDTTTGTLHALRSFSVPSPLAPEYFSSSSRAFDAVTGTLAMVFVEPTASSDWSGGDPKSAWVLQLQTRNVTDKGSMEAPRKISILPAGECISTEAETRLFRPSISYVPTPGRPSYFV